jgi:hypothetical protein
MMAGGTDDPLEAFVDRYVPRDLANVPGRYTVLRRQALRDLRALLAAEREACARAAEASGLRPQDDAPGVVREIAGRIRARGSA